MAHASFHLDAVTWPPASRELPGHLDLRLQEQLATAHDTTADQHSYEVVAGATQAAVTSAARCQLRSVFTRLGIGSLSHLNRVLPAGPDTAMPR